MPSTYCESQILLGNVKDNLLVAKVIVYNIVRQMSKDKDEKDENRLSTSTVTIKCLIYYSMY